MLKNRSLGVKIGVGFGLLLVLTVALGAVGLWSVQRLNAHMMEIGVVRLPSVQTLLVISANQIGIESAEKALLSNNADEAVQAAKYAEFDEHKELADQAWEVYAPLPQTVEEAATG